MNDILTYILRITCAVTCFAIFLQSIEFWSIRNWMTHPGAWSWENIRTDFTPFPRIIGRLFERILGDRSLNTLLIIRMLLAGYGIFIPPTPLWLALFGLSLLLSIRWRGAFNGGSDAMTLVVLLGLSIATWPHDSPRFIQAGLAYIAVQSLLSYFRAGVAKLNVRDWRRGLALARFIRHAQYSPPKHFTCIARHPLLLRYISITIIIFELAAPLCLLSPSFCIVYLGAGALFHALNTYYFGLNRFFWIWLATYPSIYQLSLWLQS